MSEKHLNGAPAICAAIHSRHMSYFVKAGARSFSCSEIAAYAPCDVLVTTQNQPFQRGKLTGAIILTLASGRM